MFVRFLFFPLFENEIKNYHFTCDNTINNLIAFIESMYDSVVRFRANIERSFQQNKGNEIEIYEYYRNFPSLLFSFFFFFQLRSWNL